MFTTIKTKGHNEIFCPDCLKQLDEHGGISRIDPEWGEDVITPDMVTTREPNPDAGACTWCGALRWLSERLISRLSPLRRAILERRLTQRYYDAGLRSTEHEDRAAVILGRCLMLISNAELRERSDRHG